MTKEEFEEYWSKNAGYTLAQYHEERITTPCNCDYENCQGWGAEIRMTTYKGENT